MYRRHVRLAGARKHWAEVREPEAGKHGGGNRHGGPQEVAITVFGHETSALMMWLQPWMGLV